MAKQRRVFFAGDEVTLSMSDMRSVGRQYRRQHPDGVIVANLGLTRVGGGHSYNLYDGERNVIGTRKIREKHVYKYEVKFSDGKTNIIPDGHDGLRLSKRTVDIQLP